MKALTLTQPWATAVALGSKRVETRSWKTSYRGQIAIHAAKGYSPYELIHQSCYWNWAGALWGTGYRMGRNPPLDQVIPFGAIVAVATLADCRPATSFTVGELDTPRQSEGEPGELYKWTERQLGDFSPGRFGFVLVDVTPLAKPVVARGMLNLWNVPPLAEQMVLDQLSEPVTA